MKQHPSIAVVVACGCASTPNPPLAAERVALFQDVQSSSQYVAMRDGVRIAVEVVLPKDLATGEKLPALFRITREGRVRVKDGVSDEDRFWVGHGFARVLIDQRGTGASFGTSQFGASEVPDLYDLADWVVKQSWSDGRIGAIGTSFEGTAAELLAAAGHPAVRAVAPLFSDYNYYTDLVRPGGMFTDVLLKGLFGFIAQLDAGGSARRVDSDRDGSLVTEAIAEHRSNLDAYAALQPADFGDDALAGAGISLLDISAVKVAAGERSAQVPRLILASWYDAGTAQGALQRFHDEPGPQQVFIGAWSHGGDTPADPFLPPGVWQPGRPSQQRLEALQFFARTLKGGPEHRSAIRRIYYYTIGAASWRSTEVWPPEGLRERTYYLSANRELTVQPRGEPLRGKLATAQTGEHNRWLTQLGGHAVDYTAALKDMAALLSFTTQALAEPMEVTGQPVLHLRLACTETDPAIVAYLVVIDPSGTPFYITEGHLRLLHRKLAAAEPTLHSYARRDAEPVPRSVAFDVDLTLLPTSVLVPRGGRLQLLLASGDRSAFAATAEYEAEIASSSRLVLPVR